MKVYKIIISILMKILVVSLIGLFIASVLHKGGINSTIGDISLGSIVPLLGISSYHSKHMNDDVTTDKDAKPKKKTKLSREQKRSAYEKAQKEIENN